MGKILIVDDEPAIRFLLLATLEDEGYELMEAADGLQGYDLVLKENPDLLILDLMMPGLTGYELCSRLKHDPAHQDTLILMLTARVQKDDEQKAKTAGADYYMPKPFSPLELVEAVHALLQKRK